ncbi:hypothetical protein H113_06601 [Trichophyton rubrum MR1459]|uniref:Uncharacterized protein n=2 Tax=Trichophyton rubrum TaxID=5551 RepID=A0A178F1K2_TRIRU|nr:hypothetical protein H100_06564 [Trichophyton rubrum MR850]EZF39192.1 hypothetical protein H102_06531 [Trichophyton rubrum CBS 100081]EZF49839.1 hypothetical protein H103_06556 [Trichophyton rubrum CBS 288.86]EZF81889.1 hypothetical protein H110_06551 [Trichophyton rubrum MR1448]EZF92551.1 hypothetical protein H113_06601 [Trichophyton rubrum MR1459]EZG14161.1 hypothetical protein H107_06702 [Trichophyton rubrum CBS 202.88]OAL66004.1 hypothetical protein A7C99_3107 [Trichophyton rubrum]
MASTASSTPPKRKFVPELIESTTKSSSSSSSRTQAKDRDGKKKTGDASTTTAASKGASRFRPQLIETTTETSRKAVKQGVDGGVKGKQRGGVGGSPGRAGLGVADQQQKKSRDAATKTSQSPRKFTPQLIETGKRSFRQNPAGSPARQNFGSSSVCSANTLRFRATDSESRYSYASLSRRHGSRRQSFQVPNLPAIPSTSSENSGESPTSSLSTSPTNFSNEGSHQNVHVHCPDSYTGSYPDNHMYNLHSRLVSEKLKDQALAAFPNEQVYQPVSHFAIDREDSNSEDDDDSMETAFRQLSIDLSRFRRESTADLAWELEEMRRHKEESEMRSRERLFASNHTSKFSAAALAARYKEEWEGLETGGYDIIGGWQKGVNLAPMREAASPPMLGDDIVFTRCQSPKSTLIGADQLPTPATSQNKKPAGNCNAGGLWSADTNISDCGEVGLWNGTCKRKSGGQTSCDRSSQNSSPQKSGLVTPSPERMDPVIPPTPTPTPLGSLLQPSKEISPDLVTLTTVPDASSPSPAILIQTCDPDLEREIETEFNDSFVTQIYNYLSLGYPCLARDFDAELSKITNIPIETLQSDDQHANAKGYIDLPDCRTGACNTTTTTNTPGCVRWNALKLYIHEWARQQPRSGADRGVDSWGVPERRGSWAV